MSNESGKDLVCSGVSSIMFGLCNALDTIEPNTTNIVIGDNVITIDVNDDSEVTQTILKTGEIQLKTIQEQNKQFVQIQTRR